MHSDRSPETDVAPPAPPDTGSHQAPPPDTGTHQAARSDAASSPSPALRGRRLEPLIAWAFSLLVLLVWLVPKGFHPGEKLLGHPDSDLTKHYWNLWWFRQMVLIDGQAPFQTDYLNYPKGLALYPIEPLNGLFALLFGGPLGLPWTTNLLAVLNLAFAAAAMFILVRTLTGRFWPSLCSGLLYALSSYAIWTVYVGVGELTHLGWMPLALAFLLRLARDGGLRNLAAATALFFLTAFACWYYALFLYLAAGLLAVTDPWRGRRTPLLWARYAAVAGLSLACLLPIVRTFDRSYRSLPRSDEPLEVYIRNRIDAPPHDNPTTRIDLEQLLVGGRAVRLQAIRNPYQGGRYAGFALVLLAMIGLALRPRSGARWLLVLGTMLLLGAGSRLVVGGAEVGGRLPFAWFNLALERFSQPMNFPARFMMPVTLALVVLAGFGLSELERRLEPALLRRYPARGRLLASGLTMVLGLVPLLEGRARGDLPLPLPSRAVTPFPAAEALAGQPQGTAVLEIPQAFQEQNRRASDEVLLMQVSHGRKSAALPLDRISSFVESARPELIARPLVATLLELAGQGSPEGPRCCLDASPGDPTLAAEQDWLGSHGFTHLIVTYHGLAPDAAARLKAFCTRSFGAPLFEDQLQGLYALGSPKGARP